MPVCVWVVVVASGSGVLLLLDIEPASLACIGDDSAGADEGDNSADRTPLGAGAMTASVGGNAAAIGDIGDTVVVLLLILVGRCRKNAASIGVDEYVSDSMPCDSL